MHLICKEVSEEVRNLASSNVRSILQDCDTNQLHLFRWEAVSEELSKFAPVLRQILVSATKTRSPRSNTSAVIGMCLAILLKHRNPQMNLVQKIIAIVLYSGHSSKKVNLYIRNTLLII